MENNKTKQARVPIQIIALVFVFFAFLLFRGSAKIAIGDVGDIGTDVRGFAWSSNFGWISFNCLDTGSCASANYSVKIQSFGSGNPLGFIGHAWSPNAGWISFNETNPPDNYKFSNYCQTPGSCNSLNNCTACFNPTDGKIYGWAKVLSLGNDGWISLGTTTAAVPYRVSISQNNASSSFNGFGWNGNTENYKGLGWISFNCSSTVPSACGSSNYFTYLSSHLPVPKNLSAPNWASSSACGDIARNAILMWQFTDQDAGSSQSAFEVVVSSSTSSSSPSAYHSNKVVSSAQQYNMKNAPTVLRFYDIPYYWWVRVWDNNGFISNWVQFNTLTPNHALTDNNLRNAAIGTSKTFTIYSREFPSVHFTYLPAKPIADAAVTSTDASFYSTTGSPTAAIPCDKADCQWAWSSPNAKTNTTPSASTTVMTFPYGNNMRVNLKVTDNGPYNYSCNAFTTFFVDKLPIWIEKKAQ